ncbi:cyclic nucleotide-binding domain-containing protein [archaeon]|nr:MAG: cyclic nucleotide-binding domain-containing protein [archaeon]
MDLKSDKLDQIRLALAKPSTNRSYDDLLLLKSYLSRTEFIQKTLAGVANPRQMNDLCRNLGHEHYGANDAVFNQGDPGDKVYILLSGICEVRVKYKIDLGGGQSEFRDKLIVTYDKSGQFFGERALQFDEARSAGVICTSQTDLITISKYHYLQIVNETRNEIPTILKMEQYGTKEGVVKILSRVREKRSNQELDAVAAYLYRRVPFFQKFTMQHVVELCRVAETVTVWGRSVLFKQGQVGQAFYVILNGTVEVWVTDNLNAVGASTYASRSRAQDVTEGLGSRVNQLVTGMVWSAYSGSYYFHF